MSTTSPPTETSILAPSRSYGYIWADCLYGHDKDSFMVNVYNDCKDIDDCTDTVTRAEKLLLLRNRIKGSKRPWVEGITDFIEFESQRLVPGSPLLDILFDGEDYHAIAILHAAYLHGAFRGVCRTASGAEWIGQLGELCAAAVHQGFKWVRVTGGVTDWELPTLGESWCKGFVLWGVVSMMIAVDVAGVDPGNDVALERIHNVIGAHHFSGAHWKKYRGPHPHKWWNDGVRGSAPCEAAIRSFGEKQAWPEEMIDVLCRGARHVNTWSDPSSKSIHLSGTDGLLIWDHTPRLKFRLTELAQELVQLAGHLTQSEIEEVASRFTTWIAGLTAQWRGRGDSNDRIIEISVLGTVMKVLKESRPNVHDEFLNRAETWSRNRMAHLTSDMQDLLFGKVLRTVEEIRGSIKSYHGSSGSEPVGWINGGWDLCTWASILSHPRGGRETPESLRELVAKLFDGWTKGRRFASGDDPSENDNCPVCVGNALLIGTIDEPVWVNPVVCWGTLFYHNLGLGAL
ncbi:hypothetical protein AA313_de0208417 [Arthrobotrys entomopaga]|nr:hypothetical protein AA313_de0208417 [Arthrobotrys entomopaga]